MSIFLRDLEKGDAVQAAAWLGTGAVAALGMGLGGMTHHIALGFMDWSFSNRHGPFNWSLPVVFAAALTPPLLVHQVIGLPRRPLLASHSSALSAFTIPASRLIDRRLIGGSLLFGLGWSLSGSCPGPAVVGVVNGGQNNVLATIGMMLGMAMYQIANKPSELSDPGAVLRHVAPIIVPAALGVVGPVLMPVPEAYRNVVVPWPVERAALGGLLIGGASIALLVLNGRIMGMSGILADSVKDKPVRDKWASISFLVGMFIGGVALYYVCPEALAYPIFAGMEATHPSWSILLGGVLTGVGTQLANGCTTGHGIAGMSRFSIRSTVAVAVFMGTVVACTTLFGLVGA